MCNIAKLRESWTVTVSWTMVNVSSWWEKRVNLSVKTRVCFLFSVLEIFFVLLIFWRLVLCFMSLGRFTDFYTEDEQFFLLEVVTENKQTEYFFWSWKRCEDFPGVYDQLHCLVLSQRLTFNLVVCNKYIYIF